MSRYARRKDSNHRAIVGIFEALGCSVLVLDVSTTGAPDLLIGRNGDDQLVEVKPMSSVRRTSDPRGTQLEWAAKWKGRWVDVVRNADDAVKIANGLGRSK